MMKKFTFISLLVFILFNCSSSYAQQKLSFSTGIGYTLFIGDVIDVPTIPGFTINLETWYNINEKFSLKIGGSLYSLIGNDFNVLRNRSFRSFNLEGYAALMYIYSKPNYHNHRYIGKQKKTWKPFWYLGLGWTTVAPKGKARSGNEIYDLMRVKPEVTQIPKIALIIPFGFGIKIDMNSQYALLLDGGIRYALSDVLDGVSKSSISVSDLSSIATDYYNNISDGNVLGGNPNSNDMYWLWAIKIQYTPSHHTKYSKYRRGSSFPRYGSKKRRHHYNKRH